MPGPQIHRPVGQGPGAWGIEPRVYVILDARFGERATLEARGILVSRARVGVVGAMSPAGSTRARLAGLLPRFIAGASLSEDAVLARVVCGSPA